MIAFRYPAMKNPKGGKSRAKLFDFLLGGFELVPVFAARQRLVGERDHFGQNRVVLTCLSGDAYRANRQPQVEGQISCQLFSTHD